MVSKISGKDDKQWALEVALREIQAVMDGKIDQSFLLYAERAIKKALATS